MKSKFRNYAIHSVFRMIAIPILFITGLFVYQSARNMLHYSLKPVYSTVDNMLKLYHDFDKDGYSEMVSAYYDPQTNHSHTIVSRQTGSLINEWVVPGYSSFKRDSRKQWIDFGDVNNDGYDDLIEFVLQNDSLFLYVIDVKNSENNQGKYLITRSFLLKRGSYNKHLPWDLYFNHHAILDLENDGQKELIFTLVSGYSLSPRGIYIYNFKQKKIAYRYETNASLMAMDFFDLDNDGKKEIIVSTYAGGNFSQNAFQSDFFCWLFVFDHTLKPLFNPIKFPGFASALYTVGVKEGTNSYIIGMFTGTGKSNAPAKLLKINPEGTILKSYEISIYPKCDAQLFRVEDDSLLIYVKDNFNNVMCFDKNFKLLCTKHFPNSMLFHPPVDLDNDGEKEILATLPFQLLVLNKKLEPLACTEVKVGRSNVLISIEERGKENNKNIYYAGEGYSVLYSFFYIPLYRNKTFLLLFGSWCGLVLFLLFINSIGIEFIMRRNALVTFQQLDPIGTLIIDDRGYVVLYNMAFLKKLNLKGGMEKGKPFKSQLENQIQLVALVDKALKNRQEIMQSVAVNGNTKTVSILPMHGLAGLIVGYFIQLLDREPDCVDERTKIWTNTIKKLAHDIKTPLSNIEMGVRTVRDSIAQVTLAKKDILLEDLDILSQEVKRITNVVGNFLKFVNLEKPHFQLADIHECVQKSATNFEAYWKNNFLLEFEFESNMPAFYFDPQQMEMVFNNLIKNALDAMREKGKIIIRTSLIKDEISQDPEDFCEIEIIDNGPGIEKEKQPFIFDPNFSEKINGSGLGLTIVKKIIEDHRGEIKVFSTPGMGTTFRILLPIHFKANDANHSN